MSNSYSRISKVLDEVERAGCHPFRRSTRGDKMTAAMRQEFEKWLNDEYWKNGPVSSFDIWRAATARALERQWIPVEERLPEHGREVLVFVSDDLDGNRNFVNIGGIGVDIDNGDAWSDGTITHWMPLPEPPSLAAQPENAHD